MSNKWGFSAFIATSKDSNWDKERFKYYTASKGEDNFKAQYNNNPKQSGEIKNGSKKGN